MGNSSLGCCRRDSGGSCPAQYVSLPMPRVQIHSCEEPGASCQRQFIAFPEQSRAITVCTARTNPLPTRCFPRRTRGRVWGEAGKNLPAAEGFGDEPGDPFPHLPPSPETGSLTEGAACEGAPYDSPSWERATRPVFPRHSPYSACTRKTATVAERLWERGPRAGQFKSKAGGMVTSVRSSGISRCRRLWDTRTR